LGLGLSSVVRPDCPSPEARQLTTNSITQSLSMKITHVKTWKENLELTRPYTIAYRTIDHVENLFVVLETENGIQGFGAGSPAPFVTGEDIGLSEAALQEYLEELLIGRDLRHLHFHLKAVQAQFPSMPAAAAAADTALYDLFARNLGVPLVDFLGRAHDGLPTSITIGIKSLEETLEEAEAFVVEGFRIIKLKTGHDVEKDIETFARLRERVGDNILIRVDANQGYGLDDLLAFCKGTEHLKVEFIEQPLPVNQTDLMLQAPEFIRRKCAADEVLCTPLDAVLLASAPQPYGIYNIKLMKCGGIRPALQIAEVANHSGIELMWGCNDESIISITAALHAALASPATRYLDLDGSFDLARDIVNGGFILRDGRLYPGDGPGLGVEIE
jgi:L-Ala-D/L-Glu epimerase